MIPVKRSALALANLRKSLEKDGVTMKVTFNGGQIAQLGKESVAMTDGKDFALEPSVELGHVPDRVVEELLSAYRIAKDYATAYSDAAKAQAEKHRVSPGALKRYVSALAGGKVDEVSKEAADLARLIEG